MGLKNMARGMILLLTAIILASLMGCSCSNQADDKGWGPRSFMDEKEARASLFDELAVIIAASDDEALMALFSEAAVADDTELANEAARFMELVGGGELVYTDDDLIGGASGNYRTGSVTLESQCSIMGPDGRIWLFHTIDCIYNRKNPEKLGVKSLELVIDSDQAFPDGVGWMGAGFPAGIRIIDDWETRDPTSRYERNPYHDYD